LIGELITDRPRVGAGTVARLDAVESAVIDVRHRRFWVGVGDEKAAPNEGHYVGFEWEDLRSDRPPRAIPGFTAGLGHSETFLSLRSLLRQVQVAETMGESERVFSLLSEFVQVAQAAPVVERGTWSGLYLYVGTALTRMKERGADLATLDSLLDRALSDPDLEGSARWTRYRLHLGLLYKARLHDLQGRRAEAQAGYAAVLAAGPIEKNLEKAAREGFQNSFTADDAVNIDISYPMVDLLL
jgi:hypothetical protein